MSRLARSLTHILLRCLRPQGSKSSAHASPMKKLHPAVDYKKAAADRSHLCIPTLFAARTVQLDRESVPMAARVGVGAVKAAAAAAVLVLALALAVTAAEPPTDDAVQPAATTGAGGPRAYPAGLTQCVTGCGTTVTSCMLGCYGGTGGGGAVGMPFCLLSCTNDALLCSTGCSNASL
ncbi:hypothetical protein ABZP36_025544 [Zizania latifolia]